MACNCGGNVRGCRVPVEVQAPEVLEDEDFISVQQRYQSERDTAVHLWSSWATILGVLILLVTIIKK